MAELPSASNPKDPSLIEQMAGDPEVISLARQLFVKSCEYRYSYNFSWLGVPIIQYPQDMVALQEIVWTVRPDLIVETGIAHGGSLVYYASLLQLLGGDRLVIGVDVDIRRHNRRVIEAHFLSSRIRMIEGSSIAPAVVEHVREIARERAQVMVVLDSNHTHAHVAKELELYSPLVGKGSYIVVLDTVIEDLPPHCLGDRPWSRGNSPKTAVREFLRTNDRFEVDRQIESKLMLTVAPEGYLRCVKD